MKLLLDEMLDAEIAVQLRRRGLDVLAVQEQPAMWGTIDRELLRTVAREQGSVLVIDNVDDFLSIYRLFAEDGIPHCGLLLASSRKLPRGKGMIGRWCPAFEAYVDRLAPDATFDNLCDWL